MKNLPSLPFGNKQLIAQLGELLAEKLELTFIHETDESGNLCFANSPGLRDEYRTSFTSTDVLCYILAVLNGQEIRSYDSAKPGISGVPLPETTSRFWRLVRRGNKLRLKQS